jgi:hypothetical protein
MSAEPKVAPIVLIGGVLHLKADKQVHLKASKDSDAKVAQPTKETHGQFDEDNFAGPTPVNH